MQASNVIQKIHSILITRGVAQIPVYSTGSDLALRSSICWIHWMDRLWSNEFLDIGSAPDPFHKPIALGPAFHGTVVRIVRNPPVVFTKLSVIIQRSRNEQQCCPFGTDSEKC